MRRKLQPIFRMGGLILTIVPFALQAETSRNLLMEAITKELERSVKALKKVEGPPLYFLQYHITDREEVNLSSSYGTLKGEEKEKRRYLRVDARVGSPLLDNTHELRGGFFDYSLYIPSEKEISLEDDPASIRGALWAETDRVFKEAQERFIKVETEKKVKVEEEDPSPDFSREEPNQFFGEPAKLEFDPKPWVEILKRLSLRFKKEPWILSSLVSLRANATTRYIANSEGTKIIEGATGYYLRIFAETVAEDGMELFLHRPFFSRRPENLPKEEVVAEAIDSLIQNLKSLREGPVVEPYTGPAILMNQASGVFFHEIFGHRIEGHRQKSEKEGQTFTKKLGEKVLADFISVHYDPTLENYNGKELNGSYHYDDEGVSGKRVTVAEKGVLKNFLMSRSPVKGFPKSNGHGRCQHGYRTFARQSNLIVESAKEVPFQGLRENLIAECKKQGKPYGLIFDDISGGFTGTMRYGTQTFKVIPLMVRRVYADGRPDEIVRGVDIVGTPLLSFTKILATGDDTDVFNGFCGAESGAVPVALLSPSILVEEIEVEKKMKSQEKPPLLPPPFHDK